MRYEMNDRLPLALGERVATLPAPTPKRVDIDLGVKWVDPQLAGMPSDLKHSAAPRTHFFGPDLRWLAQSLSDLALREKAKTLRFRRWPPVLRCTGCNAEVCQCSKSGLSMLMGAGQRLQREMVDMLTTVRQPLQVSYDPAKSDDHSAVAMLAMAQGRVQSITDMPQGLINSKSLEFHPDDYKSGARPGKVWRVMAPEPAERTFDGTKSGGYRHSRAGNFNWTYEEDPPKSMANPLGMSRVKVYRDGTPLYLLCEGESCRVADGVVIEHPRRT